MPGTEQFDVLVLGGGNAGLTAAITAAEAGAQVCLLEAAPISMRGGNSRHTRNLRPQHEHAQSPMSGRYSHNEYLDDLKRVTSGKTDTALAAMTLSESATAIDWLQHRGVRFQPPLSGTLHLGRTNAFFLGGGKALVNALYAHAERLNITIFYDACDVRLNIETGACHSLTCQLGNVPSRFKFTSLIVASGGFEANLDWLREVWGDAADNFLIRGTPYNTGDILRQFIDAGYDSVGDASQCHAVAIDGRAPRFDGGIVSRIDCVPFGIVVNQQAKRFYDEGEDFWPKRYAIWGRLIAAQPNQVAWSIIDASVGDIFMPTVSEPVTADSIEALGSTLGLDALSLKATIDEYNARVVPGNFDHTTLDQCHTAGLSIPKSHWARQIITPPFRAYEVRCGITFTYLGLKVDANARVQLNGMACPNIFAAGEIMAGNVLGEGYLAGIGMTIGHVFGRIAGQEAARYVA